MWYNSCNELNKGGSDIIMINIKEILERNPVIPAIKNKENLNEAINSNSEIIFVIMSNLINIDEIVSELKEKGKIVFIHIDMVEGLSNSSYGIEYLINRTKFDGIITTKHNIVSFANKNKIPVIQRFFILDSFSFKNTVIHIRENKPSAVEILPGVMPKIIKRICNLVNIAVITGGLVDDKEDIINALAAGAEGVSTTKPELWKM